MIRIYDKEERLFTSLGIGSLDDAIESIVIEEINGSYELEMDYPISGRHYNSIKLKNLIFCKPNPYSDPEPFRIYSITKPINGIVTISAEHISYDMSGITVLPKRNEENDIISYGDKKQGYIDDEEKDGYYLDDILNEINESSIILESNNKNLFTLHRNIDKNNIFREEGYYISMPMNLRSILGGSDGSILDTYKGEWKFSKFNAYLYNKRGVDRGLTIRYGKNMVDLEQEINSNNQFTGIFPFYSKTYTESNTTNSYIFQNAYVRDSSGSPFKHDWLTLMNTSVGDQFMGVLPTAMIPLIESSQILVSGATKYITKLIAVEIQTPGEYKGKLFAFKKNRFEDRNLFEVYISGRVIEDDEEIITNIVWAADNTPMNPQISCSNIICIVKGVFNQSTGDITHDTKYLNKNIIYDCVLEQYEEYTSDGFYTEVYKVTPEILEEFDENYDEPFIKNGKTYVKPRKPAQVTTTIDKYIYHDLIDYTPGESPIHPFENGIFYVNNDAKQSKNQKILSLDLTSEFDEIENFEPNEMNQEWLFDKAEQYMKDKDLTKIKESITISFIKLSDSPEYAHFKELEKVELGDVINVIYEDLGVRSKHRVISTEYNVLTDSYNEIELGDKVGDISNTVVITGDNISSLKNDAEYGDKEYIKRLIVENLDTINATIENAIIGYLEVSNANIDQVIARLLTSDNATIKQVLKAGNIEVTGHIEALSGNIGGSKIQNGELIVSTRIAIGEDQYENVVFEVTKDGKVTARDLHIKGGTIEVGDDFEVNQDGEITARDIKISGGEISVGGRFSLKDDGELIVNNIKIYNSYDSSSYINIDLDGLDITVPVRFNTVEVVDSIETNKLKFKLGDNLSEMGIISNGTSNYGVVTVQGTINPLIEPDPINPGSYIQKISIETSTNVLESRPFNIKYTVAISIPGELDKLNVRDTVLTIHPKDLPLYLGDYAQTYIELADYESIIHMTVKPSSFLQIIPGIPAEQYYQYVNRTFGPLEDETIDLGLEERRWEDIYSVNAPNSNSDRNVKKDINYDISNYDELFDRLKPVSFKFKNGTSGRTHMGFISQDLKDILEDIGMDTKELAAYTRSKKVIDKPEEELTDDDYKYGIRYSEFIALLVDQVQKLKQEVKELKTKIE